MPVSEAAHGVLLNLQRALEGFRMTSSLASVPLPLAAHTLHDVVDTVVSVI